MISVEPTRESLVARPRHPHYDDLLPRLEASYEFHTERLTRLAAVRTTDPDEAHNRDRVEAASRQALTAIATALRHMAEGRYGVCEDCDEPIPAQLLDAHPETRYCARCQAGRDQLA